MRTAPAGSSRLHGAVVAAVSVAALVGVIVGVADMTGGGQHRVVHKVGESVPTSFGIVAVEHAQIDSGLSSDALGGQTHGVQGLVTDDKASVQTLITLTNQSGAVVPYSPGQFRLRAGSANFPATAAMLQPGSLQPQANIGARMDFVVPRAGERLQLEFRDRDGRSILVDLGLVDKAPPGAGAQSH
ncbi:MAG TPA: hypothetical protein VFA94_07175 [Acidimicrobiales bacterium]|nr:hypothetical protein [Acidimicrobiales bacterium]